MACSKTDFLADSTPPISKIVFFCQALNRDCRKKFDGACEGFSLPFGRQGCETVWLMFQRSHPVLRPRRVSFEVDFRKKTN